MKNHHTAVIVGGGPSGSAAAYTLAGYGIDVCIIDKAVFPRDKLCGGLLTIRSRNIFETVFERSWGTAYEYLANGVKFFSGQKLLNHVENYSELYFTRRIIFDDYLLKMAQQKGAVLYQGNSVAEIDVNNKICRLACGSEISWDYLLGADGVNSIVAKSIFGQSFDKKTTAFALEMEVDKASSRRTVDVPEIHFGVVRWGYAWVFPKQHTLTVGVGGLHSQNPQIKKVFKQFLRNLFGEIPNAKIKGHYIPFGRYRKEPGLDNILLSGDAAGLVEPITGEGIAFAIQSGYLAALAIQESIIAEQKTNVMDLYKAKYSEITHALDHANRLKYLIFPWFSEQLFTKLLPYSKNLPLKHLDLMADKIKYDEYTRYIFKRLFKAAAKRALLIK